MSPNVIRAQKIPVSHSVYTTEDVLARFCYYFHQYTFQEARRMPIKRIKQMLKVADREYGRKMYDLIQVARAASSTKGESVISYFKNLAEK